MPLLGNTIELLTKDANRFFTEAYEKLGPVFQVNYLFRNYTIMAGPESLNHLLEFREQGMSRKGFFGPVDKQIGGVVLLAEEHPRARSDIASVILQRIVQGAA